MRCFTAVLTAIAAVIAVSTNALASTYITVTASDSDPDAVLKVWDEDGITCIGVAGDLEFTIEVSESGPNSIDTCWVYINGTTQTGTTRDFTAEDYRTHYGCVAIKYDDESYEDHEFHVFPAWESPEQVETGATAPECPSFPADENAAELIQAVAENDPDGPTAVEYYCVCEAANGCWEKVATADQCRNAQGVCDDRLCP